MEWAPRMNAAVDYIEENMLGEINYKEVARIACCSVYHFQRMFSFITEVSLSEYIRRRRLSLAAMDLQNSDVKVIDLALKYGYDSPEAFTRAFQQLHGITPTSARNAGSKLKVYPRLIFQLTIQGVEEMNYRIEEMSSFRVVGVKERIYTEEVLNLKDVYDRMFQIKDTAEAKVKEQLWDIYDTQKKSRGIMGVWYSESDGDKEQFYYMLAARSDKETPEGMESREVEAATWAVFEVPGPPEQIVDFWQRLYKEWLPASNYEFAHAPTMECYLPAVENMNELWVAVIKKQ
ncbi:AraC family transcriptional regulator [Gracilibacillus ureilyticus]|uniref:AraC family transcriptional regulator n=1 Tax=Gracilibacillus ureilyticus TaxID=531814 RepID=A0A1H9U091_9BACI|nr:AraC family transcriptional regulator [Gracilibacillus ureilyticus]SES02483.1 AraC family transcriptional regulator [Gracilibacillus ureilyticus]